MSESPYLGLYLRVFDDFVDLLKPEYKHLDAERDKKYVKSRYATEGLSFLTKTLPKLGKALDASFQSGTFTPVPAFKREMGRTTPLFMRKLFQGVFDAEGTLKEDASAECVRGIRQACFMYYKLESDYSTDLIDATINSFVSVDESLVHCDQELTQQQGLLLTVASSFLFRVFRDFDPADIRPRTGPGASASGTHKSERYEPKVIHRVVHEKFAYYKYFYIGKDHLLDRATAYKSLPRKEHAISLMRLVPKDSRGPRIICMEEQELMFLQQGLGDAIRDHIMAHPLTRGHVNFRNQEVNRGLAREGSMSQEFATLDMKEASDRISRKLVEKLFDKLPELRDCLLALSTRSIRLPDGGVIQTKKFAPMGSSLCFPIMSVVHYALAVAAMHVATAKATAALAKNLYVYGDDIIVKTEHVGTLFSSFPLFGLKFNEDKSFTKGPFRESCGFDAFQGWDVSPQRIKSRFFDGRDPRYISSALTMYGTLQERGYVHVAAGLRAWMDERYGEFPTVCKSSPFMGWVGEPVSEEVISLLKEHDPVNKTSRRKCALVRHFVSHEDRRQYALLSPVWDSDVQCWTVKSRVLRVKSDASMSGGWEQLMRSQLETHLGSDRLDGRFKQYVIAWERGPLTCIHSPASQWEPKTRIVA